MLSYTSSVIDSRGKKYPAVDHKSVTKQREKVNFLLGSDGAV